MEWLANVKMEWVLLAVGILTGVFLVLRWLSRRYPALAGVAENVQVVLSVLVIVFLIIRPFLFQAFYIPSSSMEPTLLGPDEDPVLGQQNTIGDRLLVNKLIYRIGQPGRGDIAVFRAPKKASQDEKEFIKRVIGLPGETVKVLPSRILVDGRPAFTVGNEQDGRLTVPLNGELDAARRADDGSLTLQYHEQPLRIMARGSMDVRCEPKKLVINGAAVLEDRDGGITSRSDLGFLGALPGVKGTAYFLDNAPTLVTVEGKFLEYELGQVLVNGKKLPEPYLVRMPHYTMAPVKLGADEYLMLGDNRNNSSDSHVWGPVKRDRFIGRAEILFWPLNRIQVLHWWLIAVLAGFYLLYLLYERVRRDTIAHTRSRRARRHRTREVPQEP